MTDFTERLRQFFSSPTGQELEQKGAHELAKIVTSDREGLGMDLAELRAKRNRVLPQLVDAKDKAQQACEIAWKKFLAAQKQSREANLKFAGQSASFEQREHQLQIQLAKTAPGHVSLAIDQIDRLLDDARGPSAYITDTVREWNGHLGQHEDVTKTNCQAVKQRIRYLVDARAKLEALRQEYLPDAELHERIKSILDKVPSLQVWDKMPEPPAEVQPRRNRPVYMIKSVPAEQIAPAL